MRSKLEHVIRLLGLLSLWLFAGSLLAVQQHDSSEAQPNNYWRIEVKDAIGPGLSSYLNNRIRAAANAPTPPALILILLDTPGGLETAMRDINQAILESSVPVVTYVYPKGARAASAGTFMLYASHVAAMAPATNLGAASPVQLIGGAQKDDKINSDQGNEQSNIKTLQRKQVNDAVAYIRSLAELRGRNADWAESAVRDAASLSAEQALKLGVIDYLAQSESDLLDQLNQLTLSTTAGEITLHTNRLNAVTQTPDWREQLLMVLTNPNIAYLLMLLGFYGLVLEFYSPGFGVPGVIGAICLLLALFALQMLPVNYAGVALILLGLALMIAEAMVPSFGILGGGGVVAFILGSVFLFESADNAIAVASPVIAALAVTSVGVLLIAIRLLMRSRNQPVVFGSEVLIGTKAIAKDNFSAEGLVMMDGELWHAHSQQPIHKGQQVEVIAHTGLELQVKPCIQKTEIKSNH